MVADFISKVSAYLTNRQFWVGVVAAAIVILVAELLIWAIRRYRRGLKAVVMQDDGGEFSVSRKAFREFLRGVVAGVPGVALRDVKLLRRSAGKVLVDLQLALQPEADLIAVHDNLRRQVVENVQKKLGLGDRIHAVNLSFINLPSSTQMKEGAVPAPVPDSGVEVPDGDKQ